MLTFRFVAKIVRVATYSTQFVSPYQYTFRDFMTGAAQKFSLHQSVPDANLRSASDPLPISPLKPQTDRVGRPADIVLAKGAFVARSLALGLTALVWSLVPAWSQDSAQPPAPTPDSGSEDPVSQALRQRLQAWSQQNSDDAKVVFQGDQDEDGRAAAQSISRSQQERTAADASIRGLSDAASGEQAGLAQDSANAQVETAPAPENEVAANGEEQAVVPTEPNTVETQSLTGDRELDAMLSDSQKLLLVQAIQTLQVVNKEDEQARQVAATLTDNQKQALLKLLRTLEEVQADQAEGQRGFRPEQRRAILDVLETLETEQAAIERAREQAQQRARAQAAQEQNRAPQNQASVAQGLSGGLLNAEQEAALARGLAKLQAGQRAQAEGGDVQAALDMSASEQQALRAVIQLIEGLREELGDQANVANLDEDQRQALVAAVTRLQDAQRQREMAPDTQVASNNSPAGATGTQNGQANPNGPLNGGLLATLGDERQVDADLAIEGRIKDAKFIGRHKTLLYTTLRSSGSVQTGVNYQSGTLSSGAWEAEFGLDISGQISSLLEDSGPVGNYRIVPNGTVVRRLTDQISLKASAQGEFVKNAGAALGSLGLVYSRGNTELTGNVFGKYEYLATPDLPSSNPLSFIDATTIGAELGAAQSNIVLGATTTDISAKLTVSQVIDRDPTLAFTSKAITQLTGEMSLSERIAKARSEFIQQVGPAAFEASASASSFAGNFDDIFAPENKQTAASRAIVRRGDDIFAPEGTASGEPTRDLVAELRGLDPKALPYDLREETGRNFITQLIRLGYSDAKTFELSLDRNTSGLITGRASARLPQIFAPSIVGEARLSYAGQFVPASSSILISNDTYLQELGGQLMAAWQAAERTTLAGQLNATLNNDLALNSTAVALEATQTLSPYASASLRLKNSNSYAAGSYLASLNEVRASLRVRDDRYGEFEGSIGREFDGDLEPGAFVAAAAYAKGVNNVLKTGRDALFEAGLELRYDPRLEVDPELGAFVKATIELN